MGTYREQTVGEIGGQGEQLVRVSGFSKAQGLVLGGRGGVGVGACGYIPREKDGQTAGRRARGS